MGLIGLSFTIYKPEKGARDHILGGPVTASGSNIGSPSALQDTIGAVLAAGAVDRSGISVKSVRKYSLNGGEGLVSDSGAILGSQSVTKGVTTYTVQNGDTLQGIAANSGISLETILQANPSLRKGKLKVGSKITLLPTSGVLHIVTEGETLESLASIYNSDKESILRYNPSVSSDLTVGMLLVVPHLGGTNVPLVNQYSGVIASLASSLNSAAGSSMTNYFISPAKGFNWGILHDKNAVDIANSCGTGVVAAAEGLIIPDGSCEPSDNWNGGYGICLAIQHPNGLETKYAHLSKPLVDIGDYVAQGQSIGLMGKTGEATGCHLHFEVQGSANPFVHK